MWRAAVTPIAISPTGGRQLPAERVPRVLRLFTCPGRAGICCRLRRQPSTDDREAPVPLPVRRRHTVPGAGLTPPGARPACGWVFPPDDVFDEPRLLAFLRTAAGVSRLKGVFRLPHEWVAVNRVGAELTVTPTAYRRDSRVEVFADDPDWDAFERDLLACLRSDRISFQNPRPGGTL